MYDLYDFYHIPRIERILNIQSGNSKIRKRFLKHIAKIKTPKNKYVSNKLLSFFNKY